MGTVRRKHSRSSECGFRSSEFRPALRTRSSAFTLTELLVVIVIISILASLITAAAVNAMRRANEASITTEIGQLAAAAERFKTDFGGAYPPNAMNDNTQNYKGTNVYQQTINDFVRSFRKAFPRHNEPEGLLHRLAGATSLPSGDTSGATPLLGGMNAAEALYFWFGGFSSDPVYPISGPGGPSFANEINPASEPVLTDEILESRNVLYEFDLTRLGPRTDDGFFDINEGRWVTYSIDMNGQTHNRRINLWTYKPNGSESSFVYFDASRHDPISYDVDLSGQIQANVFAFKKIREGFGGTAVPAPRDIDFVNKGKYQILHPGLDDTWGDLSNCSIAAFDSGNLLLFPTGPFTGDVADTLTNFTTGTLENAQE